LRAGIGAARRGQQQHGGGRPDDARKR
jgi:hypothetical protein